MRVADIKVGEAYTRGTAWSSAPPDRLVVVEHHGRGWLTVRRDDGEHERLRASDLTGPYDTIRAQHERERTFRDRVMAERLTWEQLCDGQPCPGCGRPLLGDQADLPEAAVALLTSVHADRVLRHADVNPADHFQARMLARLREAGCVHPVADGWALTDRGRQALGDHADAEAF